MKHSQTVSKSNQINPFSPFYSTLRISLTMGLFSLATAAAGFVSIGAWESLDSSDKPPTPPPSISPPTINQLANSTLEISREEDQSSSSLIYTATGFFSLLFVIDSLISVFNALSSNDPIGVVIPLQVLAIAALFCLYSILGLASKMSNSLRFPPAILDLILLFAFSEEFLLYYQQRKDTSGIENRYFDLMLVPIFICVVSTIWELKSSPKSNSSARLARGVGLILQGTWFLQMGISFYSNLIVSGCSLHQQSRGNYTIKCKGHEQYHRARGIATLQFNCHLAFLVILVVAMYSSMSKKNGLNADFHSQYKPLGSVMQQMAENRHFTLDSDEDEEIREEGNVHKEKFSSIELSVNGNGSHL